MPARAKSAYLIGYPHDTAKSGIFLRNPSRLLSDEPSTKDNKKRPNLRTGRHSVRDHAKRAGFLTVY